MGGYFQKRSINSKLTLAFTGIASISVFLVCACFVINDIIKSRKNTAHELLAVASVIGSNSAAAVTFEDKKGAFAILQALTAEPEVRTACLYASDDNILASYVKAGIEPGCDAPTANTKPFAFGTRNGTRVLSIYRKISLDGEDIGGLVIHRGLGDFERNILEQIVIAGIVLFLAILVSLVASRPMGRFLTDPISQLVYVAKRITTEHEYSIRAEKKSDDELGVLTGAFNEMLEQIERRDQALELHREELAFKIAERTRELRTMNASLKESNEHLEDEMHERERAEAERIILNKQLIEASRQSGMAEVATGVLHNVGNVLNSVNVSITILSDAARRSKTADFERAMAIIEEHLDDPGTFISNNDQGRALLPYLVGLSKHLRKERESNIEEFQSLSDNIEHIKKIINMQQSYATMAGVLETVRIEELLEDAIQLNLEGLEQQGVEIVRDFEGLPPITVDKHKVIQILFNLVTNAKQALRELERTDKNLTIRAKVGDDGLLRIEVIDNGPGIDSRHTTKIFTHGFTTKEGGHGFGLHSSATAARAMQGSLVARSDGRGHGATFILEIPTAKDSTNRIRVS